MRNSFHLIYVLTIVAALTYLSKGVRQRILLAAALPVLVVGGLYAKNWSRHKTLDRRSAILIGFPLLNIGYLAAVANLLSSFENNGYRFPFDAFYVVLLGVALEQLRLRRYGTATAANGVVATAFPLPSKRSTT